MMMKSNLTSSQRKAVSSLPSNTDMSYEVLKSLLVENGISEENLIRVILVSICESLIVPNCGKVATSYRVNPFVDLLKKAQEAKK
jgi:hypothetical protein